MSTTNILNNNKPGQDISHPTDYLQSLLHEDEERLSKLFNRLDLDGNGKIDIYDLSVALREFGVSHGDAEVNVEYLFVYAPPYSPLIVLLSIFPTLCHRNSYCGRIQINLVILRWQNSFYI